MAAECIVQLEQVSIFQEKHLVLSTINLSLNKGEYVYLIGETGSGKSSLLKTLYADLPLTIGEGKIAGFNLKGIKQSEIPYLRRKLGIVFQDFQLLADRTVYDNLYFVLQATGWKDKQKMKERIDGVLAKVDSGTKAHKMPHELSGGEQQRIAIARALLNDPEVILADEPTGNLDPKTSEGIGRLLVEISKTGCTILVATHDFSLIKQFPSKAFRCENGLLVQEQVQ